jgi:hypothetical protein
MRDVISELKALRLHGMAATWIELGEQNNGELERSRWLAQGRGLGSSHALGQPPDGHGQVPCAP